MLSCKYAFVLSEIECDYFIRKMLVLFPTSRKYAEKEARRLYEPERLDDSKTQCLPDTTGLMQI